MNASRYHISRLCSSCNSLLMKFGDFGKNRQFFQYSHLVQNSPTYKSMFLLISEKSQRRSLTTGSRSKTEREYRFNNAIKAKNVRLIDQNGRNLGVVALKEALEKGRLEDCIVVEVRHTSSETVCKLISQKQLYEKKKEEKKMQVKTSKTKEIKLTGKITDHDLEIKLKKIVEFLQERDSVKVLVTHRRIQNTSFDDKKALVQKIAEQIGDTGYLQGDLKTVGNSVRALFVPLQKK